MREDRFDNKNKGFSLVEMLAVVAILIILLGVSAVGVVYYRDLLKITELDNAAREIYMAAENRAVLLSNARRLSGLVRNGSPVSLADGGAAGEAASDTAYVVQKSDASLTQLLPAGSVDPTLRSGDFYIVYEPASGSVTDVFYAEQSIQLMEEASFEQFYKKWSAVGRQTRMKAAPMLGRYSGGSSGREETETIPTPQLTVLIKNEERLTVEAAWWLPKQLGADQAELKVSVLYGGKEEQLTMSGAPLETPDASGTGYTCVWVLDELESEIPGMAPRQFKGMFPGTATGGNFTVNASLSSTDGAFHTVSASDEDNSLFAEGSGGDTAIVKNLRHLQNLSAGFSGVSGKTAALQRETILCRSNETYPDYPFQPISGSGLRTYDGGEKEIRELYIPHSDGPAGLFASVEGFTFTNISLINAEVSGGGSAAALAGEASNTTLLNCRVFWRDEGQTNLRRLLGSDAGGYRFKIRGTRAGGLIGSVPGGSVTIQSSFAAATISGEVTAGGLIGRSSGGVTLRNSYADCYITAANAAGLVGELSGSADVTDSYAAGFIVGDNVKKAAGLSLGSRAKVETNRVYSVMRFPNGAETWALTQSQDTAHNDDFVSTYYLGVGTAGTDEGRCGIGLSYGDMTERTDRTNPDGSVVSNLQKRLGGAFAWKDARDSAPYNLQQHLDLTVYSFPGLSGLPHYGDWGAEFKEPSLVYYEYHGGKEYRFSGGNARYLVNTLEQDKPVLSDGYAIAFLQSDVSGIKKVTALCVDENGTEIWRETSLVSDLISTVGEDGQKNRAYYYLMPLSEDVVNGGTPVESIYQYLRLELSFDGNLGAEGEYFYNPHFAETVVPYLRTGSETAGWTEAFARELLKARSTLSVRTPRHLNNLGRFPAYCRSSELTFTQNLDLNYATYRQFSGQTPYVQDPIGTWSAPFGGIYEGNCNTIQNVLFTTAGEEKSGFYAGLFGCSEGVLRNIVYELDPERDEVTVAVNRGSQTVYAGALVGINGGTVNNCAVSGVRLRGLSTSRARMYIGGLAGQNNGVIRNSAAESAFLHADASFFASDTYLGGLVGENTATISASYAVGRVGALSDETASARACGFVGYNSGRVENSYAAVDLRAESKQVEIYGFCGQRLGSQSGTYYLNDGNFTYREESYAASYVREGDRAVGTDYNDLLNTSIPGMRRLYDSEDASEYGPDDFPYPTGVRDAGGKPVHYGQWPARMALGEMGVYYWERLGEDYHISLLAVEPPDRQGAPLTIAKLDTLSTAHSDGLAVTGSGYGYYIKRADSGGELKASFSAEGVKYFDADLGGPIDLKAAETDQAVNQALELKMPDFVFHSYPSYDPNTPGSAGLYPTGDPNGRFVLKQDGTEIAFAVNPHFAEALSVEVPRGVDWDTSKAPTAAPGTGDNPFGIRSVAQLELINWNRESLDTRTVIRGNMNHMQFPYLSTSAVTGKYHWTQTHDLNGNGKSYTPIAEYYDATSNKLGNLYGWFGGSYNGQDYVIENVSVQGQQSSCAGLFGVVYGGTLEHIILYDSEGTGTIQSYSGDTSNSCWYAIGALAGVAAGGRVDNCAVAGYTIQADVRIDKGGWGGSGIGGLVGISHLNLENCSAVTDIVIPKTSNSNDNMRVGGLVGTCQGSITGCYAGGKIEVSPEITIANGAAVYIGGIVGGSYLKPLTIGGGSTPSIGIVGGGAGNSAKNETNNSLSSCYSYVTLPARDPGGKIKSLYAVGGTGELNDATVNKNDNKANHGVCTMTNCFYLASEVLANNGGKLSGNVNGSGNQLKTDVNLGNGAQILSLDYPQLSGEAAVTVNGTTLDSIYGFLTSYRRVTTSVLTAGGDFAVNGKYSYPPASRGELKGMNYPFPTILTREDSVAAGGSALRRVHYGAWPLEGIRRERGAEPITLDIFANPEHAEQLGLSDSVPKGGVWTAGLDEGGGDLVEMSINPGTGEMTLSAKTLGTTTLTVTYTVNSKSYILTLDVSVTAELHLLPSAVTLFQGENFTLPLTPGRKRLDSDGADADMTLPQAEGFVLSSVSASGGGILSKIERPAYVPAAPDPDTGEPVPEQLAAISLQGDTPGLYTVNVGFDYTHGAKIYPSSGTITVEVLPLPQASLDETGTTYTLPIDKRITAVAADFTAGDAPLTGDTPIPNWDQAGGTISFTRGDWPADVRLTLTLTLEGREHTVTIALPPKKEAGPESEPAA